jgi:hypothetical protein
VIAALQAVEKRPSAAFPSSFVVAAYPGCTPHFSGFRGPCICALLISLKNNFFNNLQQEITMQEEHL